MNRKTIKLLVTIFFGFLGIHKFMERNYKEFILQLFNGKFNVLL